MRSAEDDRERENTSTNFLPPNGDLIACPAAPGMQGMVCVLLACNSSLFTHHMQFSGTLRCIILLALMQCIVEVDQQEQTPANSHKSSKELDATKAAILAKIRLAGCYAIEQWPKIPICGPVALHILLGSGYISVHP